MPTEGSLGRVNECSNPHRGEQKLAQEASVRRRRGRGHGVLIQRISGPVKVSGHRVAQIKGRSQTREAEGDVVGECVDTRGGENPKCLNKALGTESRQCSKFSQPDVKLAAPTAKRQRRGGKIRWTRRSGQQSDGEGKGSETSKNSQENHQPKASRKISEKYLGPMT